MEFCAFVARYLYTEQSFSDQILFGVWKIFLWFDGPFPIRIFFVVVINEYYNLLESFVLI